MIWQDIVIAAVQWILLIALIPSMRHPEHKPALYSSLMTGSLLIVLGGTMLTLELWSAGVSALATSGGWFFLAYQRWHIDKKRNDIKSE